MTSKHWTVFLLAAFSLAWIFNYKTYNKSEKDKSKEDLEVLHAGFKEAAVELFDSAIDAHQVADCASKNIYSAIQSDPVQLELFRVNGLKKLRPSLYDSIQLLFVSCIQKSIIDSNYTIAMVGREREIFKNQIQNILRETALQTNTNLDTLCNCVLSKMPSMTLKEYFEDDKLKSIRFSSLVGNCLDDRK